jgi:hypothetical protein
LARAAAESLQLELTHEHGVNGFFNCRVEAGPDQDLPWCGASASSSNRSLRRDCELDGLQFMVAGSRGRRLRAVPFVLSRG